MNLRNNNYFFIAHLKDKNLSFFEKYIKFQNYLTTCVGTEVFNYHEEVSLLLNNESVQNFYKLNQTEEALIELKKNATDINVRKLTIEEKEWLEKI